jgi:hypothetical protein
MISTMILHTFFGTSLAKGLKLRTYFHVSFALQDSGYFLAGTKAMQWPGLI